MKIVTICPTHVHYSEVPNCDGNKIAIGLQFSDDSLVSSFFNKEASQTLFDAILLACQTQNYAEAEEKAQKNEITLSFCISETHENRIDLLHIAKCEKFPRGAWYNFLYDMFEPI